MGRPTKEQVAARGVAKLASQGATLQEVKDVAVAGPQTNTTSTQSTENTLVSALVQAIQATKPIEKKTVATFKSRNAFQPKNGEPRAKLKRKSYQHGILLNKDGKEVITNEEIELFNKLRPGTFCDGDITVVRRRDKGVDIDYKIRTASQRLKLINKHGLRNFKEIMARCIEESENPTLYKKPEDDE